MQPASADRVDDAQSTVAQVVTPLSGIASVIGPGDLSGSAWQPPSPWANHVPLQAVLDKVSYLASDRYERSGYDAVAGVAPGSGI